MLAVILMLNIKTKEAETLEAARIEARTAFEKDVVYRRWNAMNHGVYAPITKNTPANPYLKSSSRDITTPSGMKLTKINPAYMARQVHELAEKAYRVKSHITSLNPIRPENAPDAWEAKALGAFIAGTNEVSSVEKIDGIKHMRLMSPLLVEKSCIECHGEQGYKVGDIRGGISISVPMDLFVENAKEHIFTLFVGYGLIWFLGISGITIGAVHFSKHIKEREHAEKLIKSSLREKEVLLQEVHHRVKNNMQVIISLLRLQAKKIEDKQYMEMFKESENRIKSMALIHEKLYMSEDLANVDFSEYVRGLIKNLFISNAIDTNKIQLAMDIEDISFDLENAIPCGLLINELISNCLKHAFPTGQNGEITIALHAANENAVTLSVGDNGVGLPDEIDFRNSKTMGLHLIEVLAEGQLGGKIEVDRANGLNYTVTFERRQYNNRV